MDEKDLELQNGNTPVSDKQSDSSPQVNYEENDNWQFEAEAPTLKNDLFENITDSQDASENQIKSANPYETAERPVKKAEEKKPSPIKSNGVKNDKWKFAVLAVVMAVVIAVSVVLGVFYYTKPNSNERMNPGNVAMTIGDTDISIGMYNYYYTCIYQNYASYASYGYYNLDTSTDYSKQKTTNSKGKTVTWADLFVEDTIDQLKYITCYYEKAVADGITLTDEQKLSIETNVESLKEKAAEEDKSVDAFIAETYGENCGVATLKKMLTQCYIAENYFQKYQVEQNATSKEINKFFEQHKKDYQNVTFAYLQMPYGEMFSKTSDQVMAEANKYVSQIKSVKDMKKILPVACKDMINTYVEQGYTESFDSCAGALAENIETSVSASEEGLLKEALDWLFDSETKIGSVKAFDDSENSLVYILYKVSEPQVDDQTVYSVRHILVVPESASKDDSEEENKEVTYTDAEWAAAEENAKKILKKFNKTDKSEYTFAKYAEKYTSDTESTSKGSSGLYGGLYEGTELGTMVKEFENWSVDDSRKYGDTGIVKSQYGYHIMFFVEKTQKYLYNCEKALLQERENNEINSMKVKKHKYSMKKVKVAEPEKEDEEQTPATDDNEVTLDAQTNESTSNAQ